MTNFKHDLSGAAIRAIPNTYRPAPSADDQISAVSVEPTHDWGQLDEHGAQVSVSIIDYAKPVEAAQQGTSLSQRFMLWARNFAD